MLYKGHCLFHLSLSLLLRSDPRDPEEREARQTLDLKQERAGDRVENSRHQEGRFEAQ